MAEEKSTLGDDLNIEYLPDDGGVKVNGKWYVSLERYFEKREEELKQRSENE